jgi:hypothetical protein
LSAAGLLSLFDEDSDEDDEEEDEESLDDLSLVGLLWLAEVLDSGEPFLA